jgi:predicted nucleic acid-binding protein
MKKLKIYLDTSIISHLEQGEKPAEQADCRKLFDLIRHQKFVAFTSYVTLGELDACPDGLRQTLNAHLNSIPYTLITENLDILSIADQIVAADILKKQSSDDCEHIAAAVTAECDIIVSLNFKHLVNIKTINGVRRIMINDGYFKPIDILAPKSLVTEDTDDD